MDWFLIFIAAIIMDLLLGDPPGWPHPICFIGFVIRSYEKLFRRVKYLPLRLAGYLLTFFSIITVVLLINTILNLSDKLALIYQMVSIYLLYTSIAARCLHLEVRKVYHALKEDNIPEARKLLSFLVGRETSNLNKKDIIKAVVETVAENTIDGILAPIFYIIIGIIFDIPVQMVFIYKTINTLDSMVGYMQEPYKKIGFAPARLDDIANYIPARIGSLLMLLAGVILRYDGSNGFKILKRDKRNHKSPNCGYPESVTAGLLKVQLGGTNTYFGQKVYKPIIGDRIFPLRIENIIDAVKIMYGAEILFILLFIVFYPLIF